MIAELLGERRWLRTAMFVAVFLGLLSFATHVVGREPSALQKKLFPQSFAVEESTHSLNVSTCPGYTLNDLQETKIGLAAHLSLAGPACNAFGQDIANLTIEVIHETASRLHVKIYDTANQQFTIPESVIERPSEPTSSLKNSSDLLFNYEPSPFAFWITRRSEPEATPLFDTRISSLPPTPIPAYINTSDNSTGFDGFPLVFEDQYLQISSALPLGTNIYGLGEVVASSGFRRDVGTDGGVGTVQTWWARDVADPIDQNEYGSHPIYLEHRFNATTNTSKTHGVFLLSSAGADVLLATPPSSNISLIEYRLLGGILDFYFFSGPTPQTVIEQYGEVVGLPTWQPVWGFGFHLCRWGYHTVNDTRDVVIAMREAGIPLEVMWNDIDLYLAYRDFTSDPVSFPGEEMRAFIHELAANNQHYIPIVDAAVAHQVNDTDIYDPYIRGAEQDVFVKNPDGSEYIGQVWPGYTVFPDWFANNTQQWWTEGLRNWSEGGVEFSGIWLDMNEASSFCEGSCGSNANLSNTNAPFLLPGVPGNPVAGYPECYNDTVFGPSGNMTVNGTSTYSCDTDESTGSLSKRGLGAANETGVNLNNPPYAIHNGAGRLSVKTIATNATHAPGYVELDVHNMWGMMEEKTTHLAVQSIIPGKRPFLISRSTFPSSGKWTGHWLGDNYSKWQYMYFNIQGVLQFQIYQIPMVGADTCGFNDNTNEELCNRWMQLSAFVPFYRNHNVLGAISQEPYRWESVANASRTAMAVRHSMLPYWYTLFANASTFGSPPVRALFYEFPNEPELFAVDRQFLIGRDILVTPVLTPNASTVDGIFPGRGQVTWRDWYTHEAVDATPGANTTLSAPLGHINVHIRDGAILLLHAKPAYTIEETRQGPYELLIALAADGSAFGTAYIDDGVSYPPGPSTTVTFWAGSRKLDIRSQGAYEVGPKVISVTVLGMQEPTEVAVQGKSAASEQWEYTAGLEKLVLKGLSLSLNEATVVSWK
ncbi:glycoside hydrolase family 31 protein [Neolentinus lepideus HHB14362 ss-1]|uniref:Glycoside hydrolase family 31 protein n=1 Tax=Neolentinus lepideus HHB14362 ss-1 TaxID=1314782 RepID=A0A165RVR4_9AGAM|nr:glycoside hydrolase family 31 protein [Neolentinus lepideus HHB14362 ss-1]